MNQLKKVLTLATITLLSMASSIATAGPIVTNWDFEVDTAFMSFSPAGVVGSNNNAFYNAPTTLTWGVPATNNGASSLVIGGDDGNVMGSVVTNGAAVNTITMTHNNFPIFAPTLTGAMLRTQIVLTPTSPAAASLPAQSIDFDINFTETVNAGPCADASSPIPCNDIFVLDIMGAGFNTVDNSITQPLIYNGNDYNIRLFIQGISQLGDSLCAAAGVANGCFGFSTVESASNTFQVSLDIVSVPEPSSIVLLSLAGFGFVAARRRRQTV